jgi:RND family efflux transporter MFP subunit
MKKTLIIVACAVAATLAVFMIARCTGGGGDAETSGRGGKADKTQEFVAFARGRVDIEGGVVQIAASRDGVLQEVAVEEGAKVKKGEILARIDAAPAELTARLAEQEAEQARKAVVVLEIRLRAAQREAERLRGLRAQQVTSEQELSRAEDALAQVKAEIEQAQSLVDVAEAKLRLAANEVEQRIIRAPADGLVVRRFAKPGEGVSTVAVSVLFWFAPDLPRIVRAELEEDALPNVSRGQFAEIMAEGDERVSYQAHVQRVGMIFGPKRPAADDPSERQDVRIVECILLLGDSPLLIGQRVIVRFIRQTEGKK